MPTTAQKTFALLAALVGWASLLLQLVLVLDHKTVSTAIALLQFFTYFTIQSNLLAALMFTVNAFPRRWKNSRLNRPSAITAVAAYITVVGIIYNTLLRGLVELRGLNTILNELHHVILPFATLLFWLLFIPKKSLQWHWAFIWLLYPIAYILWVMIVGAATGFYPYPFTNATVLGYPRAFTNGLLVLVGFLVVFFVMIAAGRIKIGAFNQTPTS